MQLEKLMEEFKANHSSVFWKDAIHCSCFPADEKGNLDLPDDILAFIRKAYLSGLEDAEECLPDKFFPQKTNPRVWENFDEGFNKVVLLSHFNIKNLKESIKE